MLLINNYIHLVCPAVLTFPHITVDVEVRTSRSVQLVAKCFIREQDVFFFKSRQILTFLFDFWLKTKLNYRVKS